MTLEQINRQIQNNYKNTKLVFGEGVAGSSIMLIGEAPGKDELLWSRPFVGKAGKNLDEFLAVLALSRKELYISNVCKFRPTKVSAKGTISNRPPTQKEIEGATGFLMEEVAAVRPKLVVTLGNVPLKSVLANKKATIGEYHGKLTHGEALGHVFMLFALYHPASIIYNRDLKSVYDEDLRALKGIVCQYKL